MRTCRELPKPYPASSFRVRGAPKRAGATSQETHWRARQAGGPPPNTNRCGPNETVRHRGESVADRFERALRHPWNPIMAGFRVTATLVLAGAAVSTRTGPATSEPTVQIERM